MKKRIKKHSGRQRKLAIINYRAEKLSRKAIQEERKKALDAKNHYLKLETELENKYAIMFDSISLLDKKAKSRSNRITRKAVDQCRIILEDARKIYLESERLHEESMEAAEKIIDVRKKLDKLFMDITKPHGLIVNNSFKSNTALKKVESMLAGLYNASRSGEDKIN